MSWCSQEQTSVSWNIFLAALPRWVRFHSGLLEGLSLGSLAICLLICCRHTPVSGGILTKTESFLEGRLVAELAGNQAGLLSASLLLESTCSRGTFHFDKSAFFQWKTFCQNISAHFYCIFILVTLCPDGKIWLLRLARSSRPSLRVRCWTRSSPIPSPWAMSVGCDIGKKFCAPSLLLSFYTALPEYRLQKKHTSCGLDFCLGFFWFCFFPLNSVYELLCKGTEVGGDTCLQSLV